MLKDVLGNTPTTVGVRPAIEILAGGHGKQPTAVAFSPKLLGSDLCEPRKIASMPYNTLNTTIQKCHANSLFAVSTGRKTTQIQSRKKKRKCRKRVDALKKRENTKYRNYNQEIGYEYGQLKRGSDFHLSTWGKKNVSYDDHSEKYGSDQMHTDTKL